jgi:serine/threonine protein kinase
MSTPIDTEKFKEHAVAWQRGVRRLPKDLEEISAVEMLRMLDGCRFQERLELVKHLGSGAQGIVDMYRMRDWPFYYVAVKVADTRRPDNPDVKKEIEAWTKLTLCDVNQEYIVPLITWFQCAERHEYAMLMPVYGPSLTDYLLDIERASHVGATDEESRIALLQKQINVLMLHIEQIFTWLHEVCKYTHTDAHVGNFIVEPMTKMPRLLDFGQSVKGLEDDDLDDDVFDRFANWAENAKNFTIAKAIRLSPSYERYDELQRVNREKRKERRNRGAFWFTNDNKNNNATHSVTPEDFLISLDRTGK